MTDTALLVIDVQNGLFRRKDPVHNAEGMLANISILIERARRRGAPIVFVRQRTKGGLVRGSNNWQIHPGLRPDSADIFVDKRYASAFKETDLKRRLVARRIRTAVVVGLATHRCVRATCLGAKALGFRVVLAADGHSNFSKKAAALIKEWNEKLKRSGVVVEMTKNICF